MNLIAHQAGVGVGTVYRQLPTRQALLEALAQSSLEILVSHAGALPPAWKTLRKDWSRSFAER